MSVSPTGAASRSDTRDRILTLDVMRGVAVMGILLLNIVGFAMPSPAYFNPAAYGGATGADLAAWLVNFVLFDGKMRGLFAFLFGASLLLVAERAEAKGENPALVHYSRMVWLLVFGLLHLWLLWWGDILHSYALIGMAAYLFRYTTASRLVVGGVMLLGIQLAISSMTPLSLAAAMTTPDAKGMAEYAIELERAFGQPSAVWLADRIALHRGDWLEIALDRVRTAQFIPLAGLVQTGWETLAYMLFGMAGLKSGMLTGAWERRRYRRWVAIGFGVGIPCYGVLAGYMIANGFSLGAVTLAVMLAPVALRPLMVIGWASLIILLLRPGGTLTMPIAAAGRMAFTNYLATSLVCTTVFYGYGLGWYGALSRAELYPVVAMVCAAMLLWSRPWLERFAYGPLEWLWRSLARGSLQPMRWMPRDANIANAPQ